MKLKLVFCALALMTLTAAVAQAQIKPKPGSVSVSPVKASAAYSEVLLHKTELTAELESLLVEYTEDYPKVKRLRAELGFLQKEVDRVLAVPAADVARLSTALGKLMIRKAQVETELWSLRLDYKDDHPDVKTTERKVQVFEAAIKEVLG